jgi:hypothetical protein
MTLRPAYSLNVAFDDFLFAPVGVESNGMSLSVMSALTRLDFDPWEKAAQLSSLAASDAIQTLASLIGRLPAGRWELKDASAIAARLVPLLPQRAPADHRKGNGSRPQKKFGLPYIVLLICLSLLAAALFGLIPGMGSTRSVDRDLGTASHVASPPIVEK